MQQVKRPELAKGSAGGQGCCSPRNRQQGPLSEHTRRTSRAASAPLTSHRSTIPLRNRADPGGQRVRGCLTTLIPRRYRTVLAREPVHNHRTLPRVPSRAEPSSTTGIGWSGLLAYNDSVARGNVVSKATHAACPQHRGRSPRFATTEFVLIRPCKQGVAGSSTVGATAGRIRFSQRLWLQSAGT